MRHLIILCIFALASTSLSAQTLSWKKLSKLADQLYKEGDYAAAAENYQSAWKQKTKNKDLIFKAAESYAKVKEYRKAADAYAYIKDDNKEFNLVGLKYARALKQDGQYKIAKQAFTNFISAYKGTDRENIVTIVQSEMKGCDLATELMDTQETVASPIEIEHLNDNVNTPVSEYCPMPFSDDILYFASNMTGETKIYRSQRIGGVWSKAQLPKNFPAINATHYCNGAFSPDSKRFYFTQCEDDPSWAGINARCQLFVTRYDGTQWGAPEKLKDYVNEIGTTSTQPFVTHVENKEVIYFSSNRKGGHGGMDIWYMARDLRTDNIDFTLPKNVGSKINTAGDEVTPFYDINSMVLYFGSNGRVGLGGFDIYQSNGSQSRWETVENLGLPINSSADDYYYTNTGTNADGYFVSNRLFGLEKIATKHEDIFAFTTSGKRKSLLSNSVFDKANLKKISDVEVTLYEVQSLGKVRLLQSKISPEGDYKFALLPNKNYRVEATKDGYAPLSYEFNTDDAEIHTAAYGKALYLEAGTVSSVNTPSNNEIESPNIITNGKEVVTSTTSAIKETASSISNPTPSKPVEVPSKYDPNAVVENTSSTVESTINQTTGTVTQPSSTTTYPSSTTTITQPSSTTTYPSSTTTITQPSSTTTYPSSTTTITQPSSTTTYPSSTTTITQPSSTTTYPSSTTTITQPSSTTTYPSSTTTITQPSSTTTYPSSTNTITQPSSTTTYPSSTNTTSSSYANTIAPERYTTFPKDGGEIRTSAPKHTGVYYKVQLIAVANFDRNHKRYDPVRSIARMDTEYIVAKGLTRVLLADFYSESEAKQVLSQVKKTNQFRRAFIIKYQDGVRIGRWN